MHFPPPFFLNQDKNKASQYIQLMYPLCYLFLLPFFYKQMGVLMMSVTLPLICERIWTGMILHRKLDSSLREIGWEKHNIPMRKYGTTTSRHSSDSITLCFIVSIEKKTMFSRSVVLCARQQYTFFSHFLMVF